MASVPLTVDSYTPEENGRVTRFQDGTYTSWLREELGAEWRSDR